MLSKRIIPCLDVRDGKVVKGINFVGIREVGDPEELARQYYEQGADELVFLDITATHEGRRTMAEVVEKVARQICIPFTVGGGITSLEDMKRMLRAGADKVSVNSSALRNPDLIRQGADMFGNQCIVLAVDAKKQPDGSWHAVINGGRIDTGKDVLEWVKEAVALGAGEILLTSMDADGTKQGFDIELCKAVRSAVPVPVIASGGAGTLEHFKEALTDGRADAALAASLFHYKELEIRQVKSYLREHGIPVRLQG